MSNLKPSAVNVVSAHYENLLSGVILHLMGSLFCGSVHKTPGTKVADERDSTSSSGAEYSWAPT